MYIDFEIFTVVLSGGAADPDFRGFLIQGRVLTDGTTPAGTFTKNGDEQQTVCTDAVSVKAHAILNICLYMGNRILCMHVVMYLLRGVLKYFTYHSYKKTLHKA